tara:strand:- start:380 stop:781 length:402 start_codon:yes stop_codon:yes gene_type:complete
VFKTRPASPAQQKGLYYEKLALEFLRRHGLRLQQKNYHCRLGEIDLILLDAQVLVFAEVRFRARNDFGTGFETVGRYKQQKLIRCAQFYLLEKKLYEKCDLRFDILSISRNQEEAEIHWIKNAFSVEPSMTTW